jgi:hypothetical protein
MKAEVDGCGTPEPSNIVLNAVARTLARFL